MYHLNKYTGEVKITDTAFDVISDGQGGEWRKYHGHNFDLTHVCTINKKFGKLRMFRVTEHTLRCSNPKCFLEFLAFNELQFKLAPERIYG